MYVLLQKKITPIGTAYKRISESENLDVIGSRLKSMVVSGECLEDFRVVKDVEFEFKCAIKWYLEEEER